MFSSSVKAEGNANVGGRYVRVESASEIEHGAEYLITYIVSLDSKYNMYAMSTSSTEGRFSSVVIREASNIEDYPKSVIVSEVNASNTPYEYVFEQETKGWSIKGDGGYLENTVTSSSSSSMSFSANKSSGTLFTVNEKSGTPYKLVFKNTKKILNTNVSATIGLTKNSTTTYFSCSTGTEKYVILYKKDTTGGGDTPEEADFTMSHVGYATLYYGTKDVTLPEGLQAFTYSLVDKGNNKMYLSPSHTYNAGDKIPAGVGVVLTGDGGNYTLTLSDPDNNLPKYDNVLKGTDTDKMVDDENSIFYRLSLNNEGDLNSVGFYWGEENGAAFVNQAHKAYLPLPNSASAKSTAIYFSSMDDNATKVIVPTQKKNDNETQYDILGRKVRSGVNGIRISKGKKLIAR